MAVRDLIVGDSEKSKRKVIEEVRELRTQLTKFKRFDVKHKQAKEGLQEDRECAKRRF